MRVVVDATGALVGVAYTDTVLQDGQHIVNVTPTDYDKLQAGARVGSIQGVLDLNRSFRESPQLDAFLQIDPATVTTVAQFFSAVPPGDLLRLLQLLVKTERSDKRQLNTIIRSVMFNTDLSLVVDGDDDFGPGA